MNRLERLYAVNEAIRRADPRPVSAAELAERFEVSRRTIERDLDALRHAGAPLFANRGRTGGHRSLEDPKNVVLSLSVSEVSAMVVAMAASGPDLPYGQVGRAAVDRLLDVLPDPVRVGVEDLRSKVRTSADGGVVLDRTSQHALERGVQESLVVNLRYVDRRGAETSRSVDPIGFLQRDSTWFLLGWCHLRGSSRMFRFDRIRRAKLTSRSAGIHDFDEALGWVPYETEIP